MAIKKKVTYSVSYVAGTDTLTTKLNSLLQDIVTLILSQNTGLTVLDTITVGSARWTGAPLYDTYNSKLLAAQYKNRHYESDVVFIGTDEDNVCISLGFFDGCLVVAMNMSPKVEAEYVADWTSVYGLNASTYLPVYATGKQSRWWTRNANAGKYFLPYRVINNTISMSVIYWNAEYSRGYSFVNGAGESDGTDLVIFPTDEGSGQTGLGAAIWDWGTIAGYHSQTRPGITVFSFAENLSDNKPDNLRTDTTAASHVIPNTEATQVLLNGVADWRCWSNVANNVTAGMDYHKEFQALHFFGGSNGGTTSDYGYRANMLNLINRVNIAISPDNIKRPIPNSDANQYFATALMLPYNLPYLQPGQAYIRKMRIPGWNPDCKGEIYLLWSPVLTAYQSGDIVEVGSKTYAIITEGAVCWAARVS